MYSSRPTDPSKVKNKTENKTIKNNKKQISLKIQNQGVEFQTSNKANLRGSFQNSQNRNTNLRERLLLKGLALFSAMVKLLFDMLNAQMKCI